MSEQFHLPGAKKPSALPPWHMWGGTRILEANATGISSREIQNKQVARVNYRRPENWRFWISAKLLGGNQNTSGVTLAATLVVDLIAGIGRSIWNTEGNRFTVGQTRFGMVEFVFQVPNTITPGQQPENEKYVTAVLSPLRDDSDATSRTLIDHVVAQDLSVMGRLAYPGVCTAEVTCFLAPNVHVRPDWFVEQFAAETGGT